MENGAENVNKNCLYTVSSSDELNNSKSVCDKIRSAKTGADIIRILSTVQKLPIHTSLPQNTAKSLPSSIDSFSPDSDAPLSTNRLYCEKEFGLVK